MFFNPQECDKKSGCIFLEYVLRVWIYVTVRFRHKGRIAEGAKEKCGCGCCKHVQRAVHAIDQGGDGGEQKHHTHAQERFVIECRHKGLVAIGVRPPVRTPVDTAHHNHRRDARHHVQPPLPAPVDLRTKVSGIVLRKGIQKAYRIVDADYQRYE